MRSTAVQYMCALLRGDADHQVTADWSEHNWLRFVDLAREHGLSVLLQPTLAGVAMPSGAAQRLRSHIYESAGHNLRLYRTLAAVAAAVDPAITLIVLKGAALGPSLYTNPAQRPLSDIDLLAPLSAIPAIRATLLGLGFSELAIIAPEIQTALEHHAAFYAPDGSFQFEIHWGLITGTADRRTAPVAWYMQHTEAWTPPRAYLAAAGPQARLQQLDATAALLYQSAHLILHHGNVASRLIWLYDLHLLITRATIDWDELFTQAVACGWLDILCAALRRTVEHFATPLPPAVAARLDVPLDPQILFHRADSGLYSPKTSLDQLQRLPWPTRIAMAARLIFPNPAYLRASYQPRWGRWWPLAYPYRWLKPLRILLRRIKL